jgi:hypothetical protein
MASCKSLIDEWAMKIGIGSVESQEGLLVGWLVSQKKNMSRKKELAC